MQDLVYFFNHNLLLCLSWVLVLLMLIGLEVKIRRYGPKKLSTAELVHWVNNQNAVLYDIRPRTDFDLGHISQAISTPQEDFFKTASLVADKPIVIVCKDGIKSSQEAFKLMNTGHNKEIGYLNGGVLTWQSEGLPTIQL